MSFFSRLLRDQDPPPNPALARAAGLSDDYTIQPDFRGEMIYYREPGRYVGFFFASFAQYQVERNDVRTWMYEDGSKSEAVTPAQREALLARTEHGMRKHYQIQIRIE